MRRSSTKPPAPAGGFAAIAAGAAIHHCRLSYRCCPTCGPSANPGARIRVVVALVFMVLSKVATVYVPVVYGRIVDALAPKDETAVFVVPVALIVAYGAIRDRLRRVRRNPRRPVRLGPAARRAAAGAAHLPPSARRQPALSPRPPDRRPVAGHRPRRAGHAVGAAPRRVQRRADGAGTGDGHRHHLAHVRLALRRRHLPRGGRLCRLHRRSGRPPRPLPPDHERHRQRRLHQVAGQPDQLRNGQVFRQRGA